MKQSFTIRNFSILVVLFLAFSWSCSKKEDPKTVPTGLTTAPATNITSSGVTIYATLSANGGETLTERGVAYSKTNATPTKENEIVLITGTSVGNFAVTISGLEKGTKYYARPFASNRLGTTYGPVVEFTTLVSATFPKVITAAVSSITISSVISGGKVENDGGATVTERGIYYGENLEPGPGNGTKIEAGIDTGSFISAITGLKDGVQYHIRAYAINSTGTGWGNDISFYTDSIVLPTVSTAAVSAITSNAAKAGGRVVKNGGVPITERGLYYGKTINPGPDNGGIKLVAALDTGAFSFNLTGLTEGTKYFVRAYAINSKGTGWGPDSSFTTLEVLPPSVSTLKLSKMTFTGISVSCQIANTGAIDQTISDYGIYYGTDSLQLMTTGTKVSKGTNQVTQFSADITGLTSGTKYFIMAYATNSPSGKTGYGNILSYTPPPSAVVYNGKTYSTVIIGEQVWFSQNLMTKQYQNGNMLEIATDTTKWIAAKAGSLGALAYWEFNDSTSGAFYNAFAIKDPRNLCPVGWKVPQAADFEKLDTALGGANNAAVKLKSSDSNWWTSPGDNVSGFNALGSGKMSEKGKFLERKSNTEFYTTSAGSSTTTLKVYKLYSGNATSLGNSNEGAGHPVRCLMIK